MLMLLAKCLQRAIMMLMLLLAVRLARNLFSVLRLTRLKILGNLGLGNLGAKPCPPLKL